jgi:hypothetical protein
MHQTAEDKNKVEDPQGGISKANSRNWTVQLACAGILILWQSGFCLK